MAITKFESYYNKIREILEDIKLEQEYNNLSLAFAHWFLKVQYNMNEQEIAEALIDGNGDNGIDAVIYPEDSEELTILQFKFPSSPKTLNDEIKSEDILKTLLGFNLLIGNQDDPRSNNSFIEHKERLKDKEIYSFKIIFVSFNKGIIDNKSTLDNFVNQFERDYGGNIEIEDINKNKISNIFEKINRKNSVEININYKNMHPSYNIDKVNSYMGVINGKKLIESIEEKLLVIFDENIRLFESDSKVNYGIKNTASSKESEMFYFYNNGIVFICDEAQNSPNSLSINLKGASIVNGCQTVNSMAELFRDGKLKEDVDLLVRIIIISDYDERAKITEFLNSQTPIKDSYFISNHTLVRELQTSLQESGYYLERQINESKYKKEHGEPISSELRIIKLDDAIQYFTGYWIDKYASLAKSGKGALFNRERIEEILKEINSSKVIEAYEIYEEISKVITSYRKMRRNHDNAEFANYLKLDKGDILNEFDDYLFMNTGDILLLNSYRKLKEKYELVNAEYSKEEIIKEIVFICKNVIKNSPNSLAPATSTKTNTIFSGITDYINENY